MTNLEKIRDMSVVELARFIDEIDTYNAVSNRMYCYEVCPMHDEIGIPTCEGSKLPCSNMIDVECIVAWLEHEVRE